MDFIKTQPWALVKKNKDFKNLTVGSTNIEHFKLYWSTVVIIFGAAAKISIVNSLSANLTKWSSTFKKCVSCCQRIAWVCLTILWGWCLKGYNPPLKFPIDSSKDPGNFSLATKTLLNIYDLLLENEKTEWNARINLSEVTELIY